jgi:hypothetical protein
MSDDARKRTLSAGNSHNDDSDTPERSGSRQVSVHGLSPLTVVYLTSRIVTGRPVGARVNHDTTRRLRPRPTERQPRIRLQRKTPFAVIMEFRSSRVSHLNLGRRPLRIAPSHLELCRLAPVILPVTLVPLRIPRLRLLLHVPMLPFSYPRLQCPLSFP